jgi:hypothetical protein
MDVIQLPMHGRAWANPREGGASKGDSPSWFRRAAADASGADRRGGILRTRGLES